MNWFTLLKQSKLRTGSKVTTNLGIDSKQEDDTCKRKLLQYYHKLERNPQRKIETNFLLDDGPFKDMPEEVACKALKRLNGLKLRDINTSETWFADIDKEQVVVGNKRYFVGGGYTFSNYNMLCKLDLVINDLNLSIPVIWFQASAFGPKEKVMEMVDWR